MNSDTPSRLPLGDVDPQFFLDEIWQQRPHLIKNAYPDFKPLISAEELAGLACEEGVESRIIIENTANSTWQLQHGPFNEAHFSTLPKEHWSLLVQAVDWWLPEAQQLLEDFNFLPRWRRDDLMISYATKGGGVGPHYDHYDVFLLQASGLRRWEIGGHYNDQSPRVKNAPLLQVANWVAEKSWTLNPGDMLYIPPGIGHNGIALDDECMTYSIGFRAPSHAEILCGITDLTSEKLSSDKRFTDNTLIANDHTGKIHEHAISQLSALFQAVADDKKLLAQWLGQSVTATKYPDLSNEHRADHKLDVKQLIVQNNMLKHTLGTRMAIYENGEECTLFINEIGFTIDASQRPLATNLCSSLSLDLTAIEPRQNNIKLISKLLEIGALEV